MKELRTMEDLRKFVPPTNKQIAYAKKLGINGAVDMDKHDLSMAITRVVKEREDELTKKIASKRDLYVGARVSYGRSEEHRTLNFEERGLGTILEIKGWGITVKWDKSFSNGKRITSVRANSVILVEEEEKLKNLKVSF